MTDTTLHLIVSHAGAADDARRQTLAGLRLPHLSLLLSRLERMPDDPAPTEPEPERTLSLPHERARARALGLPGEDGHLPWAAWRLGCPSGSENMPVKSGSIIVPETARK